MSTPAAAGRPSDRGSLDFPNLTPTERKPKVDSIFDFSDEALQQLRLWLEMHPPAIPVAQVLGFAAFTALPAPTIQPGVAETTNSLVYTNLATVGPQLSGVPAGQYIILFGALASSSTGSAAALMGISINGAVALDAEATGTAQTGGTTAVMTAVVKTLPLASNSIVAKYRVDAGTGTYVRRWLIALKYSNA
jgi:hypothetical protein